MATGLRWIAASIAAALGALFLLILVAFGSTSNGMAIAIALLLGGIDLALLRWATSGERVGDRRGVPLRGALALSWIAVAMFGMHNIEHRATSQVVSQISLQTGVELALFGAVGIAAVSMLLNRVSWVSIGWPFFAVPLWMIASAAWSDSPWYALARGAEMVALYVLAAATAGFCALRRRNIDELCWLVMRWLVIMTSALIVAGVLLGPVFVLANAQNLERFTWIGAHPGDSGFMLGVAAVILASTPAPKLGLPALARPVLLAVMIFALYQNQTRTTMAGFVVVGVYWLVRYFRRHPGQAAVTFVYLAGAGIVAAGAIGTYILRDDDASALWTLNGRTELWQVAYAELNNFGEWLIGLGYGAGRVVFLDQFRFAGSAHNSLLGAIIDLGLVGAVLLVAVLIAAIRRCRHSPPFWKSESAPAMFGLLLFVFVSGLTSDKLIVPSFASAFTYLVASLGAGTAMDAGARGPAPARATVDDEHPETVDA